MSYVIAISYIIATFVAGLLGVYALAHWQIKKVNLKIPDWITEDEDDDGWGNNGDWGNDK
jgi:hypothetical protein